MIDVIIPAFNNATHISKAIGSVLDQTITDFRIIIIDDGSTDNTRAVVQRFQASSFGTLIKYIYQENKGPAAARNKGIQESDAEFIAFLDADDTWLPEKLSKQVAALRQNPPAGFVYTDSFFVDEDGHEIANYVREIKKVKGDILLDLFKSHLLMTPAVMLRRSCLQKTGMFKEDLRVGEDYDFFLRLAQHFKAEYIDEKLWNRTVIKTSLSRQDYILDANNDLKTLRRFLAENPNFYQTNRTAVKTRMSDYYFTFGYRLLEEGKNARAFVQLIQAFRYFPSITIIKNILLCALPHSVRKLMKKNAKG